VILLPTCSVVNKFARKHENSLRSADWHCFSVVLSIQNCCMKQVCIFGLFIWVVKHFHLEQCHHDQQISILFVIAPLLYKTYLLI